MDGGPNPLGPAVGWWAAGWHPAAGGDALAADLNRALLARQGLLEPLEAPLPAALDAVCGIQAQYAPSMYVGLVVARARASRART